MKVSALLTSAGINIGICALLLFLYSILRKQPGNANVYFGRRLAEQHRRLRGAYVLERFVPSPSWILKALQCTEDEILAVAGLDAVVFLRILVFSIRIFSIAAVVCVFGILPFNYFGQKGGQIPHNSLERFTIGNVPPKSRWLWVHCLSLYIVSISACVLLYHEYKRVSRMRLIHITHSAPKPSHFTVLVRGIPKSKEESFDETVTNFFTKYYASSYLSHQMVYKAGKVQKMLSGAEKVCRKFMHVRPTKIEKKLKASLYRCGLCGSSSNSFQLVRYVKPNVKKTDSAISDGTVKDEVLSPHKECGSAFIFFKTRYAALITSSLLQTSTPMAFVPSPAPEPDDVYWSNLWLPYRQLWLRRIGTLLVSLVCVLLFLFPVTFVQGLSQLDSLQKKFPFLKGVLKNKYMSQVITGYLPSVILMLFLLSVPPLMMLLSALEGPVSHSTRKKSAVSKVLYFTVWNVFFANVLSGTVITQINVLSSPKDIPMQLARAVPGQATFFITYVLTSGWASLSTELMQLFPLLWNAIKKYLLRWKAEAGEPDSVPSFPYHTEIPKLLLFGLLGFTCSILAPLILPFLLIYFFLGFVVYRNQMLKKYVLRWKDEEPTFVPLFSSHTEISKLLFSLLGFMCSIFSLLILTFLLIYFLVGFIVYRNRILNVYCSRYETGGLMWPTVHNTTIFSLVLTQIISLGVFGLKESPVSAGFVIPLIIFTLLFNEYCRQRFHPLFKTFSAQDMIEMDREDEESGRMEQIHERIQLAYCQFPPESSEDDSHDSSDIEGGASTSKKHNEGQSIEISKKEETSIEISKQEEIPIYS